MSVPPKCHCLGLLSYGNANKWWYRASSPAAIASGGSWQLSTRADDIARKWSRCNVESMQVEMGAGAGVGAGACFHSSQSAGRHPAGQAWRSTTSSCHMKPSLESRWRLESGWDRALSEVGEVWLGHPLGRIPTVSSYCTVQYSTVERWRGHQP